MPSIYDRHITLPKWLDDLLFNKLSASYCRKNKDLIVLDWGHKDILGYLGTYFPRSFAESYCIFSKYLNDNRQNYRDKTELSVFDFGCGTGGELIGLVTAVSEQLPSVKHIDIRALDGNVHALRILEYILENISQRFEISFDSHLMPIVIDDFYDMGIVTDIITQSFDFIISFKAICEFVTRQQFEEQNPYEHVINVFSPKLTSDGIICLADVTSYSEVSNDWLPKMLDRASNACNVEILCRNCGFNEEYHITHSHHTNDTSKIAWRIYKINN
jgi:SAM-dependent methyltransferase